MLVLFVISCSRVETNYPSLFIDNSNEVKFAAFAESYSGLPAEDGIKKLTNMKYDIYSFTRDGKVVFYRAAYTVKGELVKSYFDDDKKAYYTANYTMIGDTIKLVFKGEKSFFAGGVLRLINKNNLILAPEEVTPRPEYVIFRRMNHEGQMPLFCEE